MGPQYGTAIIGLEPRIPRLAISAESDEDRSVPGLAQSLASSTCAHAKSAFLPRLVPTRLRQEPGFAVASGRSSLPRPPLTPENLATCVPKPRADRRDDPRLPDRYRSNAPLVFARCSRSHEVPLLIVRNAGKASFIAPHSPPRMPLGSVQIPFTRFSDNAYSLGARSRVGHAAFAWPRRSSRLASSPSARPGNLPSSRHSFVLRAPYGRSICDRYDEKMIYDRSSLRSSGSKTASFRR